jgi:hypothetical protein
VVDFIVSTGQFRRTRERQTATPAKPAWPPAASQAMPKSRALTAAPPAVP